MSELLQKLSDPGFMPHGHCYLWKPDVLWLHVGSDAVITLAYYMIPVILGIYLYKRRQDVPYPEIFGLFIAFILLCGTTHLMEIVTTWHPAYRLEGWIKAATALVSILTAIVLVPKLPELIALPGIQQAYDQVKEINESLQQQNVQMKSVYELSIGREDRIMELKHEVNKLLQKMDQPLRYQEAENVTENDADRAG
jgi:hypothetical protein